MSQYVEQNVTRILYVVLIAGLSLILISPFIAPIIFAGTIALALYPVQRWLESRGLSRNKAAATLTSVFGILISIPFFFFIVKGTLAITVQLQKFSSDERFRNKGMGSIITILKRDVIFKIQEFGQKFGIKPFLSEAKVDQYMVKINSYLLDFFQTVATNLPTIALFFLVMVACTYSFLKNAHHCRNLFQKLFGFSDEKMDQLVRIFIMDSRTVYISNISTGAMQSLIVSTATALLGLGDFFLVFFVTLILSFIPVIGAAPVALVIALIAYLQGNATAAIIMLVVSMVAGVSDNILRPYLASAGESKLPTIAAFVFVVGGALLLGFPGLFIGLLVGSFAYDTLPLFWKELGRSSDVTPVRLVQGPPREETNTLNRH